MDTRRVIVLQGGTTNPDVPRGYGPYRSIRIWLDDVPEAAYAAGETLVRTVSVPPATRAAAPGRVAVEWYRQLCHGWYACLGAAFEPAPNDILRIEVVTVRGRGQTAQWALIPDHRCARSGLPAEFAVPIIDAVSQEVAQSQLGGGTLRFDRAAHDRVQSSEGLFRVLALACIRLPAKGPDELSDAEAGEVLYSALPWAATPPTDPAG